MRSTNKLETKANFVITGASTAIGHELIRVLSASKDAAFVATTRGRNLPRLRRSPHQKCVPGLDLLDEANLLRLVQAAESLPKGPLNVVNCVGYFPGYRALADTDVRTARDVVEQNLICVHAVLHALLPLMVRRGGGHLIAFSSHAVYQSFPAMGMFLATKSALETLFRCVANEYGRYNVTATVLALATLDTPAERALHPGADYDHWLQPDDVVRVVRDLIHTPPNLMNGNVLQVYKYSDAYFGQAFVDRARIRPLGGRRFEGSSDCLDDSAANGANSRTSPTSEPKRRGRTGKSALR